MKTGLRQGKPILAAVVVVVEEEEAVEQARR
jgi:hypothetical protein